MKRTSYFGFYCSDCGKFVYEGYDSRDKLNLPKNKAVCLNCGPKYKDQKSVMSQVVPFGHISHRPFKNCKNPDSYGETCVHCNECGHFAVSVCCKAMVYAEGEDNRCSKCGELCKIRKKK